MEVYGYRCCEYLSIWVYRSINRIAKQVIEVGRFLIDNALERERFLEGYERVVFFIIHDNQKSLVFVKSVVSKQGHHFLGILVLGGTCWRGYFLIRNRDSIFSKVLKWTLSTQCSGASFDPWTGVLPTPVHYRWLREAQL